LDQVWIEHEDREFYAHIFNGCYAILMFIVVIFFLIYGVEVFFKVNYKKK
jgi:von Hippel-Lindau disease tumor supressor